MRSSVLSIAALAAVVAADGLPNSAVGVLEAIFEDINSYRDQYIDYLASAIEVNFPTGLIDIYTAMTTYTDNGFTSLFSTISMSEFSEIQSLAEGLPWYSTRLLPAAEADASKAGPDSSSATSAASSAAATSSVAQNSTESSFKNATSSAASSSVKLTSVSKTGSASKTASASKSESSAASSSASSSSSAAAALNAVPFAGLSLGAVAYMLL